MSRSFVLLGAGLPRQEINDTRDGVQIKPCAMGPVQIGFQKTGAPPICV